MSSTCKAEADKLLEPGPCGWANINFIVNNPGTNPKGKCEHTGVMKGGKWCQLGTSPNCARTAISDSNVRQCCLGKLAGAWSCGNQACPVSESCAAVISEECRKVENMKLPTCQQWCTKSSASHACDDVAAEYCGTKDEPGQGANDPFCACYHSPFAASPGCFDSKCSKFGYKNRNVQEQMTDCSRYCSDITVCTPEDGDCLLDGNRYSVFCTDFNWLDFVVIWTRNNPALIGLSIVFILIIFVFLLRGGKK